VGCWRSGKVYPQKHMSEEEVMTVACDIIASASLIGSFVGCMLVFFGEGK